MTVMDLGMPCSSPADRAEVIGKGLGEGQPPTSCAGMADSKEVVRYIIVEGDIIFKNRLWVIETH